jgi:hypothetical protein
MDNRAKTQKQTNTWGWYCLKSYIIHSSRVGSLLLEFIPVLISGICLYMRPTLRIITLKFLPSPQQILEPANRMLPSWSKKTWFQDRWKISTSSSFSSLSQKFLGVIHRQEEDQIMSDSTNHESSCHLHQSKLNSHEKLGKRSAAAS